MAFAKVILAGEHAVVYGAPALVAAIDREIVVSITAGRGRIVCDRWQLDTAFASEHPVAAALTAMCRAQKTPPTFDVLIESDIPAQVGLGSSAALCVAFARALTPREDNVEPLAMAGERVFHGQPSGADVVAAARGGFMRFQAGQATCLAAPPLRLAVAITGPKPPTSEMIERVARCRARDGDEALSAIGAISESMATDLADNDALGAGMTQAHELLAQMDLSTPAIDRAVDLALGSGATGAKLSGAGGGGCVIAVGEVSAIVDAWRGAGYDSFVCAAGKQ